MPIITQPTPAGDILSVYAPVRYELSAAGYFGSNPPVIRAFVYINGIVVNLYSQGHYSRDGLGNYFFVFDIAETLRAFVNHTDTFIFDGNANVMPAPNAANANFAKKCEFYVEFQIWESTGVNGVYEDSGTAFTSNTLYGLSIAANQYLAEDDIQLFGAVLPYRFLTNAPKRQVLSLGDKAYLSFFNRGLTREGVRVQTFNAAGVLQATAYIDIGQAVNTAYRVRRIAVGAADIALVTSLTNIHYYTICIVDNITLPAPIVQSEIREYFIANDCTQYSLHFLNSLGADDVIRFKDYVILNTSEKEIYLANDSSYPVSSSRGLTVLNARGTKKLVLNKFGVVNRLMPWFYELQNTSVAFAQKKGGSQYIAVVVANTSDAEAEGTDSSTRDIEVECSFAQIDYSHSN